MGHFFSWQYRHSTVDFNKVEACSTTTMKCDQMGPCGFNIMRNVLHNANKIGPYIAKLVIYLYIDLYTVISGFSVLLVLLLLLIDQAVCRC